MNERTREQLRSDLAEIAGDHVIVNSEGIETTVKKQAISEFLKSPTFMYIAAGVAALFVLPKILKR
jgi:hypothetical protein